MPEQEPKDGGTESPPPSAAEYNAALWERILAAVCAVATLVVIFVIVLRNQPFTDPNQVILVRTVLSLAVGIIGAVVPGFLHVDLKRRGLTIRAGGRLALFVITFFFSPRVLPLELKSQLERIEKTGDQTRSDVHRIVTKFDSVFVQAVYELPKDEPSVKKLEESLIELLREVQDNRKPMPQGMQISYSSSEKELGPPVVSIQLHRLLEQDVVALSPKISDLLPLVEFLKKPRLHVGINRSPKPVKDLVNSFLRQSDPPDLHLFVHDWPVNPEQGHFGKAILDTRNEKVFVAWNGFPYKPEKWATTRKVVSIQDLDKSQFALMLSKAGNVDLAMDRVASNSRPVWINLRFDNNFVTFANFKPATPVGKWSAFAAMFPSADDILSGKASHSLDSSYGWGF